MCNCSLRCMYLPNVTNSPILAVARAPQSAMNPATDAGKRELLAALRNHFTELWVGEPAARADLAALAARYLSSSGASVAPVEAVVDFYLAAKAEAVRSGIMGAGGWSVG